MHEGSLTHSSLNHPTRLLLLLAYGRTHLMGPQSAEPQALRSMGSVQPCDVATDDARDASDGLLWRIAYQQRAS
jgi:hypothetical protein